MKTPDRALRQIVSSFLICFLILQSVSIKANASESVQVAMSPAVTEAAEVLGVKSRLERVLLLQGHFNAGAPESVKRELLQNKSVILRKLVLGYLEVRQASDSIDSALEDTYCAMNNEVKIRDQKIQLVNIATFTQLGTLLCLGAGLGMHGDRTTPPILTCIAGADTLVLSLLGITIRRSAKSRDERPPNMLAGFLDLKSAEKYQLPDLVEKFVNSVAPGQTRTRKEELLSIWKTRFYVDSHDVKQLENFAAVHDNTNGEAIGFLSRRLVLLYSLNALVEKFDSELLALLRVIETPSSHSIGGNESGPQLAVSSRLSANAVEAANLLGVRSEVRRLMELHANNSSHAPDLNELALDQVIIEKVLDGALEVRKVTDGVDQQKHYEFDVVLAELTGKRDRELQLDNRLNFMLVGVIKPIAGGVFLNGYRIAGTELLMVLGGCNFLLATIALHQSRGGKRKLDSDTNILADVLDLKPPDEYRLSPLMLRYLNSVPPNSPGQTTRRDQLISHWKQHGIVESTDTHQHLQQLAAMPSLYDKKIETIASVNKRLRMLFDLRAVAERLDGGLSELLAAVQ